MPDIVTLIANTGGTLGLAIFAIWMLQRTYKDAEARREEEKEREKAEQAEARAKWQEERRELLGIIERNTCAWVEASEQLAIVVEKVNGKK
jgi:hypothetical protein